jgi:hypothetical protein
MEIRMSLTITAGITSKRISDVSSVATSPVTPQSIIAQLKCVSGNTLGERVDSHISLLNQISDAMQALSAPERQAVQQKISNHYTTNSYIGSAVTSRLNPDQRVLLLGAQEQVEFRPVLVNQIEIPEALALLKNVSAPIAAASVPIQTTKAFQPEPKEPSLGTSVSTPETKAVHVHRAVTPVEHLANLIQTTHEWADHVAIQATANATNTNIIVIDTRTQKASIIEPATPSDSYVGVSYNGGHYQAVVADGTTVEAMKIVGDCFYDSVAFGLNLQTGSNETAQSLRSAAATELRSNPHLYEAFTAPDQDVAPKRKLDNATLVDKGRKAWIFDFNPPGYGF